MHEIPQQLEQLLRAQGVGDAELDQLRRTGRIERGDGAGESVLVQLGEMHTPTAGPGSNHVSVDGIQVTGATIPPEALEKLRKFHRFIPSSTLDQLERATGQDIDGDGAIGRGDSAAAATGQPSHVAVTGTASTPNVPVDMVAGATGARIPTGTHVRSGAMPNTDNSGPFVNGATPSGIAGKISLLGLIAFLLIAVAIAYVVLK